MLSRSTACTTFDLWLTTWILDRRCLSLVMFSTEISKVPSLSTSDQVAFHSLVTERVCFSSSVRNLLPPRPPPTVHALTGFPNSHLLSFV